MLSYELECTFTKGKSKKLKKCTPPPPPNWFLVKAQKPFEVLNEKLNPCNAILCLLLNIH